ncbi:MAG TPA: VOC family protein [Stellaceae bacterium]|nr:VOC family protein [Stellaceae bacterium]
MTQRQPLRLAHVSLSTPDLACAIRFYCDVLGAEIAHEFRNDKGELYGAFLHVGEGTFIELFNDPAVSGAEASRFRHLCFEVTDIEAMAEHLRHLNYVLNIRRGRTDGILQFLIEDADGNKIEFQQHDERSTLRPFLPKR